MILCPGCYADLPWIKQACIRCALPISSNDAEAAICGSCLKKPPSIDQSHCLFIYDYPIDRIISALKFNQQLIYGHLLGQLLANHITEKYKDQKLPDAIIPVPLHNSRLRERGFNQAQEIARICSRQLSIPLALQAARFAIEVARGGLLQAGRLENPELELLYADDFAFKSEGERAGSVGFAQSLPVSARLSRETDVAGTQVTIAEAEVRNFVRKLVAAVQSAFYSVRALGPDFLPDALVTARPIPVVCYRVNGSNRSRRSVGSEGQ